MDNFVKGYEHLSESLAHFTTTTHQIWLNLMTVDANFENCHLMLH